MLLIVGAVIGCGGDGESSRPSDRIAVAALGDSITAGSPAWDPDPAVREPLGSGEDPKSQYEYWASRKDRRLRFRNCGVFGERTDQIAARLDSCSRDADFLIIQGGINDIAQGRSVNEAADNLRGMVRAGQDREVRVAITDVLPWNNGFPEANRPIRELNRRIEDIGHEEGVPVLPFHATLEDPRRRGRMRAQWTSDGDHPSVEGYRRLGERAFELLPPSGS